MSTSALTPGLRVKDVRFAEAELIVSIADGRTISVPLVWYPRLLHATVEQRARWELAGAGYGIRWPEIDENLSTKGLPAGAAGPGHQQVEWMRAPTGWWSESSL